MSLLSLLEPGATSTCAMCHGSLSVERTTLPCGHPLHMKCALDYFKKLENEGLKTCPSCHFEAKASGHTRVEQQEKPVSEVGKGILCEATKSVDTAPSPEKLKIFITYMYEFGGTKKEGTPIEIEATATLAKLKSMIKDKKEFNDYFEPNFQLNGKSLCNDRKKLTDVGLISGSTIVVMLSEPLQD